MRSSYGVEGPLPSLLLLALPLFPRHTEAPAHHAFCHVRWCPPKRQHIRLPTWVPQGTSHLSCRWVRNVNRSQVPRDRPPCHHYRSPGPYRVSAPAPRVSRAPTRPSLFSLRDSASPAPT